MVGSQTANLTPGPSFAYNLGDRCPNGQMRGHFQYLRFKTFPMTPRTPQCEVFWALLSNSKHSRVSEDSKSPTLGVLGFTPTLGQNGVATVNNPDLQGQALLVESISPGCFLYSQDGIHLCTNFDTSRPCQAIHCGNGHFGFCLGSYPISIWNRWVATSNCFLFTEVNQCRNQLPGLR